MQGSAKMLETLLSNVISNQFLIVINKLKHLILGVSFLLLLFDNQTAITLST